MAVTEAQLLGVPIFVTEYASAREQVEDGVDGIVAENSEEGVYIKLKELLSDTSVIEKYRANTKKKDYSNLSEIEKVYKLIEG